MRVVTLMLTLLVALTTARPGWASALLAEHCCCESDAQLEERAHSPTPRVDKTCCCKPVGGPLHQSPPPTATLTARELQLAPPSSGPVIQLARPLVPPPSPTLPLHGPARAPPLRTLLSLHTSHLI